MDVADSGKEVGKIPVSINYRIIDLFSGHLYSNPAKAIEELVVNSYDAFAKRCDVLVPDDWDATNARILVWDDGEGMDFEGLQNLWLVADTYKRGPDYTAKAKRRGRLPVGKFGIGKLASYVVGRRITHVSKTDRILAVTMDFSRILPESDSNAAPATISDVVTLSVRELSEPEAKALFGFTTNGSLPGKVRLPLFGPESPKSWTLVVVDHLKEEAKRITRGRLRWIISSALPLVPNFEVYLNGDEVKPSKLSFNVLKKWQVGKDDKIAAELGYPFGADERKEEPFNSWIDIPHVGRVSGVFEVYEESLLGGKAEDVGRSHGFFLMIRRRLVNHDDPLLGIHALSHMTFNRFRAVIHADDLDNDLVASRESVSEVSRNALEKYLLAKFGEVRTWYEAHIAESAMEEGITDRLASVSGQLVRFPIIHALDRIRHERGLTPRTISVPPEGKPVVDTITDFELAPLDPTDPLAVFDATSGIVKINTNHPYYLNYSESPGMEAFAAAEVLLEAYLYESKLAPSEVSDLLTKRDELLRALVRERPRSVIVIAQQLRDAVNSPAGLEEACHRSFRALGFEVVPLGGNDKPDGLASVAMATRFGNTKKAPEGRSYKLVYDAKSTSHEKVKASNLNLGTLANHRSDYKAQYAAVIAVEFETEKRGEESRTVKMARQQAICLVTAKDFATLVEASGVKPLSFDRLEELFRDCRSPEESRHWIERFNLEKGTLPELRAILERGYELQKVNPSDPPSFGAIKYYQKDLNVPEWKIKDWLTALSRLLPDLISVSGDKVELRQTPEIIVQQFRKSLELVEKGGT